MLRKMRFLAPAVAVLLLAFACRSAEPTAVPAAPTVAPVATATTAVAPPTAVPAVLDEAYVAPDKPANELDWVPSQITSVISDYPGRMEWYTHLGKPTTEPRYGGTIVRSGSGGYGGGIRHWDWTQSTHPIGAGQSMCLGRFLSFNQDRFAESRVTPIPVPDLFESWKQIDDLTWEFKLDQGAYWHDGPGHASNDGRKVTAEDAKFSLEYIREESIYGGPFQIISDVTISDPETIVIKTSEPYGFLLELLASVSSGVIRSDQVDAEGGLRTWCVGFGPFRLVEYEPNGPWSLVKHENYHLKGHSGLQLPYVDGVSVVNLSDAAAGFSAMITGKIHLMTTASIGDLRVMLDKNPGVQGQFMPMSPGWQAHLGWNTSKPPLDDIRVRRAIAMGLDHQAIIDTAFQGSANLASQIPFDAAGWDTYPPVEQRSKWYQYNPEAAKELLAEAGYPNGLEIDFKLSGSGGGWQAQIEMIPPQLKKIGVTAKISQMEYLQRYTDLTSKNYEGMIYGSGIPATNWDSYTFGWMHSTSKTNFYFIDDPEVDAVIDKARTSFDRAEQIAQFKKLFALADENLYRLNLTTPYYFSVWHDYMENASSGTYVWITSWVSRGKERIWFKEGFGN